MRIVIDTEVIEKYGLTFQEFIALYNAYTNPVLQTTIRNLVNKGIGAPDLKNPYLIWMTKESNALIDSVLLDSQSKKVKPLDRFDVLADKLRDLYPKGKKAGTNYLWRDSTAVISKRLKILATKYNFDFTDEQAIEATKKYIESFKGDLRYMQLLKYFILKSVVNASGDAEIKSEFMSYIDNADDITETNENWTTDLK